MMRFWRDEIIQPALDTDLEAAVREQEALLASDPRNPHPCFALGTLAQVCGERQAAIAWFQKAIELDPAYAAAHVSLGRIYVIEERYDLAWHHARQAERHGDASLLLQLERYPNAASPPAGGEKL
jgi:tetratricopeptide (TPR) repeat protein